MPRAQRAGGLVGLATSDAALAVLVGPAGTGKSYTAGRLDTAWRDLTAHRPAWSRSAPTQVAADVLREDGVGRHRERRRVPRRPRPPRQGRPLPDDERWRLGAADVLLVDEASMVDTAALTRLHAVVEAAGARARPDGRPAPARRRSAPAA